MNKNSLYFSLKKAIHTFRLKSIFCRILVVLVVLILGICSLFYLVISSHYRESSQEHEINGNLAALNLIGNQMEDQILKSETQLEELLDLNVLEMLASQEDIFSNPAALDIVQKLKKLADENPLIAQCLPLYGAVGCAALLGSDGEAAGRYGGGLGGSVLPGAKDGEYDCNVRRKSLPVL